MTEVEASGGYCGGDGLEGAKRHTTEGTSCFFDHSHCETGRIGRNKILDKLTVHGERGEQSVNGAPRIFLAFSSQWAISSRSFGSCFGSALYLLDHYRCGRRFVSNDDPSLLSKHQRLILLVQRSYLFHKHLHICLILH